MKKRIICGLLAALLLFSAVPTVFAAEMQLSSQGEQFLEAQYHVSSAANGAKKVAAAQQTVNVYARESGLALTQTQFDALVSFTFQFGTAWTSGCRLTTALQSKTVGVGFVNAIACWCRDENLAISERLVHMRIQEAKLYLYGSYNGQTEQTFPYLIYQANGGKIGKYEDDLECFAGGSAYGTLPGVTREGLYFAGWYSQPTGGDLLRITDTAMRNQTVYAHWSETPVTDNGLSEQKEIEPLSVSDDAIGFLERIEPFYAVATRTDSGYAIGYRTQCSATSYPNGISREEARTLLRQSLVRLEKLLNECQTQWSRQLTQNEFDALVSFCYQNGSAWVNETQLAALVKNRVGGTDFANVFGAYCVEDGVYTELLIERRLCEMQLYLNADYHPQESHAYCSVLYHGNGARLENGEKQIAFFEKGQVYGALLAPLRSGWQFTGWFSKDGRFEVVNSTNATGNVELYAHWKEKSIDFFDIKSSDWFYDAVRFVCRRELFNGISAYVFQPQGYMTRAMLVTVLWRLENEPEAVQASGFTDVAPDSWYTKAVAWAAEKGVVNGYPDELFMPNNRVTREQIAVILFRYAQEKGSDTSAESALTTFHDAKEASQYAVRALSWAVASGIISGTQTYSGVRLNARGDATRAEVSAMMMRYILNYE